ncbi:hypothetical protein AgCh_035077 [Apium graveolens]
MASESKMIMLRSSNNEVFEKHVTSPRDDNNELESFDAEFVNIDKNVLFGLVSAANYLNIKSLLDLTSQALADIIDEKTAEEIRDFFDIDKMRSRRNM